MRRLINKKKIIAAVSFLVVILAVLSSCAAAPVREMPDTDMSPLHSYSLTDSVRVDGRQGVCTDGEYYWVSGSTSLIKYDKDWNVIMENSAPFEGYEVEVNHIGDIDVYNGELYAGVENFSGGTGHDIQIAVYDEDTLKLKRFFMFEPESGQTECSGIAIDPDTGSAWMSSWGDGESGAYLYRYDLESGKYLGKVLFDDPPLWIQGVAYHDGFLFMTADDGLTDKDEPDHMYRAKVDLEAGTAEVALEKSFDDVIMQGEIEGLSFDEDRGQFLLLYNRGAKITLGIPEGFYNGYFAEISEVFTYDVD